MITAAVTDRDTGRITPPPASDDVMVTVDDKIYEYGNSQSDTSIDKTYGYGMATPCAIDKYGYGEAVPDSELQPTSKVLRRSSMKGSSRGPQQHHQQQHHPATRRASMGETMIDVRLPGKKDPVIRRRSICFEENVSVQRVIPAVSLVEDPKALWLQDIEYDVISTKILTMLEHIRQSDGVVTIQPNGDISINGTSYDSRGLEHLLSPEISELKRSRALDCVLHEQFLQRQVGEYDEDSLANIYKFTTVRSQREATHRANQDAIVADQYLESTRKMFRHRRASM